MRLITCVLLFVVACSGSAASDPNSPDDETTGEGAETDAPPENETAYERKLRNAKEKREQCSEFVDAVQVVEKPSQDIVNINDTLKLNFLAKGVERRIAGLEELELSVSELEDLNARYLKMSKDSATALRDAASKSKATDKKAALKRYIELDASGDGLIEEINQFCGGTEAPPAENADKK
jgi:hypothetical protein